MRVIDELTRLQAAALKDSELRQKLLDKRKENQPMFSKEYFKNYNYKKHAKLCAGVYDALFAFDMTVSYFILKSAFAKMGEQGQLDE